MNKTFLVGVDGSEAAKRAVEFAVEECRLHNARLVILHVIDWSGFEHLDMASLATRHAEKEKEIQGATKQILQPLTEAVDLTGVDFDLEVRHGHIAESMCWFAENENVEHVFTGKRGRSTLKNLILGSVCAHLTQICPVPITIIP